MNNDYCSSYVVAVVDGGGSGCGVCFPSFGLLV